MMKRAVTIHRPADRHREPHQRDFSDTHAVTVASQNVASAIAEALHALGLGDERGRVIVTVDWPHD